VVRDRQLGTTTVVSVDPSGNPIVQDAVDPALSGDGALWRSTRSHRRPRSAVSAPGRMSATLRRRAWPARLLGSRDWPGRRRPVGRVRDTGGTMVPGDTNGVTDVFVRSIGPSQAGPS
jgi:hypothetical protein